MSSSLQVTSDNEDNLTTITDANSHLTLFTYDAFGRVTNANFPSTFSETYAYDAISNLTSRTDRKGQAIAYVYDALNRLTKKQYATMPLQLAPFASQRRKEQTPMAWFYEIRDSNNVKLLLPKEC